MSRRHKLSYFYKQNIAISSLMIFLCRLIILLYLSIGNECSFKCDNLKESSNVSFRYRETVLLTKRWKSPKTIESRSTVGLSYKS